MTNNYDFWIETDFFEEELEEDLFKKLNTKAKVLSRDEYKKMKERQRREKIRKILTGLCKTKQNELHANLLLNEYCDDQPQDIFIDAQKNTALHYVLKNIEQATIEQFLNVLEVMEAGINPHIENIKGETALSFVEDEYILKLLEDITKTKRPDIFEQDFFDKQRESVENERLDTLRQ